MRERIRDLFIRGVVVSGVAIAGAQGCSALTARLNGEPQASTIADFYDLYGASEVVQRYGVMMEHGVLRLQTEADFIRAFTGVSDQEVIDRAVYGVGVVGNSVNSARYMAHLRAWEPDFFTMEHLLEYPDAKIAYEQVGIIGLETETNYGRVGYEYQIIIPHTGEDEFVYLLRLNYPRGSILLFQENKGNDQTPALSVSRQIPSSIELLLTYHSGGNPQLSYVEAGVSERFLAAAEDWRRFAAETFPGFARKDRNAGIREFVQSMAEYGDWFR